MSSPLETVLAQLNGVTKVGSGWKACCPAHDDRNPSLSVSEGAGGKVLLKCFAGCATDAIVETLGLTMRDLMPDDRKHRVIGHAKPSHNGKRYPTAREAMASLEKSLGEHSATWTYHNADGKVVGLVAHGNKADGKFFRQCSRTDGGWHFNPDYS